MKPTYYAPEPHKKTPARIIQWLRTHRTRSIVLAGVVSIILVGGVAAFMMSQQPAQSDTTPSAPSPSKKSAPPVVYYSPLTGEKVESEQATKQAVTAIMIENSPDARPQSGLKSAGVVYEAVAEGGITRFLALYQQQKPTLIGPVRSVRLYYVDWLAPYQASVAHVGGSQYALQEVRNGSYRDIDQFFNGSSYWRASDRYPPHNVYTNFERLDALNATKGYTTSNFTSFPRVDGKPAASPTANSVTINISGPLYNTAYTYDATSNTYLRSVAGGPSNDRELGRIAPSVVVAMKVDMSLVFEDGYRESITTSGTGNAVIFQNGIATECTWRKKSRSSPLELLDASGQAVPLIRGQTWIAAVPNGTGGVSWQ
ncbi:DUF3048 domain-containing protein [Candidatus Saccharibacteria bacterium]|nr:MAG: DUF3048 domain-containing protein [Candidatus Saccharibacteria bacterium]